MVVIKRHPVVIRRDGRGTDMQIRRILILAAAALVIAVVPHAALFGSDTGGCFSGGEGSAREEIFAQVNRERAKNNLPPVVCDAALSAIAQNYAKDMVERGFFNHTSPEGKDAFDRLNEAGISYRRAAENIACREPDAGKVVKLWMGSPLHKKNILGDFTNVGVGAYRQYYVLMLIKE